MKGKKRKWKKRLAASVKKFKSCKNDTQIILSDDSDGFEVPIVVSDEYTHNIEITTVPVEFIQSDVDNDNVEIVENGKLGKNNNNIINSDSEILELVQTDEEKENTTGNISMSDAGKLTVRNPKINENNIENITICLSDDERLETNNNTGSDLAIDCEKLLKPHKETVFTENDETVEEKIRNIEIQIAAYKKLVANLEEREVDEDSCQSPYIECE